MKNISLHLVCLLTSTVLFTGCASIISGTHQDVKITSQPDAADVKVERFSTTNNIVEWEGKTPAAVKLSRKCSYLVTISRPDYQKEEISISNNGMNGWVMGNILLGGLVGILVDSMDGAATSLQPGEINVTLVRTGNSPALNQPILQPAMQPTSNH